MEKLLSQFEGQYLGFAPTDESEVGMGEIEVIITSTIIKLRIATGRKIHQEELSTSDFQLTIEEIGLETTDDNTEITAFKKWGSDYPKLIFLKDSKGSGLVICTGGMGEMLGPTMLFGPASHANFQRAVDEIEKKFGTGVLPRLRNGGRADKR